MKPAVVVLAAGTSSRLGYPKPLLLWGGRPLILHVVDEALRSSADEVAVVLGHRARDVQACLAEAQSRAGGRLQVIVNPGYRDGQATSVRAGLAALSPEANAAVFLLVDQPLVGAAHIDRLIEAFTGLDPGTAEGSIVALIYQGLTGHPILFGRGFFSRLSALEGDEGGRSVLAASQERVVMVAAGPEVLQDIDTWEDYRRMAPQRPSAASPGL